MTNNFSDILNTRIARRSFLRFGGVALGVALLPTLTGCKFGKDAETAASTLTFNELKKALTTTHQVPDGYDLNVLIRWGDPLFAHAPSFDPLQQSKASQETQFGFNNDFIAYAPLPKGSNSSTHGLLCVNHEYTSTEQMMPATVCLNKPAIVPVEIAAHGLSVVEIRNENGVWNYVQDSLFNRRFTADTVFHLRGPAAGHARVKTSQDPTGTMVFGTMGNCSGGVTLWNTILSAEENFDVYFGGNLQDERERENFKAMGFSKRYCDWFEYIDRFNLEKEPHEANRFGWIVEYDPYDPTSTPVKRTALGRFKHESATLTLAKDGRVVVYTGDDEAFQHIYKFISRDVYHADAPDKDLLDHGTLYAARFDDVGMVTWLPLVHGNGLLTAENGFYSQADILIETRRAAKLMGATEMDRPEDIEVHPITGKVYFSLTNNTKRRITDAANPRANNVHGQLIELIPTGNDHGSLSADWDIFLLAGNPKNPDDKAFYRGAVSSEGWLSCPDNLASDTLGRLWIATDGQQETLHMSDGFYATDTEGKGRGLTKLFLLGPAGCEITGPAFTPDNRTLFLSIQHPGEHSDYDNPLTRWPDFDPALPPRPSVVAVTKKDGGVIGS